MATFDYNPRYGLENYSFVLPFETSFDSIKSTVWMQENWYHAFTLSVIYIIVIFSSQKFMESRKPYALDRPLALWNSGLAIFSIMGVIRMTPEMFWSVRSNSFVYSICTASFAQSVTGYWTEKFAMSKVVEFGDTAFIVLRKRPLIFLHWYHHITVLAYTWHAYKDHTASGRWFIWMNYLVHAIMYSYYAVRAFHIRPPKFISMTVTVVQILQMVVGVFIGITIYGIKSTNQPCQQTWQNLMFSFTIYFSYFLLFCNFFYHTYVKSDRSQKVIKKRVAATNSIIESEKENVIANNEDSTAGRRRRLYAD